MPKLTQAEKEWINWWLKEKWTYDRNCPLCHSNSFKLADSTFVLTEPIDDDPAESSPPRLPVVPVICENCGYTIFISVGEIRKQM